MRVLGADVRPVPAVPFDNPDNYNHQARKGEDNLVPRLLLPSAHEKISRMGTRLRRERRWEGKARVLKLYY